MKHRFIMLILLSALVAGMAACASPAAAPQVTAAASPTPAATATPAPTFTPAPTATPTPAPENPFHVTFLGEDTAPAEEAGGIGPEAAAARAAEVYGAEWLGKPQHYACLGIAEYEEELYYAVYWTQTVEDSLGVREAYMGHLYVSLDGVAVLEGNADSIYFMGGG